ncbi:hypothetical protein ACWD4G_03010 [Streptomyces sp. NPDC002643]
MRQRLRQAGYTAEVVRPPMPENFTEICDTAMRRYGRPLLERLLPDLMLGASELYRPLALELSLRGLSVRGGLFAGCE